MDIMFHIGLVILIGIFFFLDKYSPTNNAMFIVILLTFFGFILISGDSQIQIIDYYTINKNSTLEYNNYTDISNNGLGIFDVQAFIVLIYTFLMMVAVTNLFYENKKAGK